MLLVLLAIVLVTLIYFAIKSLRYWEERGVPSFKPWPLVGNFGGNVFRIRATAYILDDVYKAFPERRYVGFYNMTTPSLMIRDLELIKQVTVKEFDTFPQHRLFVPEDVDPTWNKNLFAMRGGERWQDMRATLSPSFTSSKMRMMFELMKECSNQFSSHFLKQKGMVIVDMKDVFSRLTNDVIATTAFGVTCDSLEKPQNEFYLMGKDLTNFTGIRGLIIAITALSPTLSKLLNMPLFTTPVKEFFSTVIKDTIKLRNEQGIIRPDMVHLLMEARKGRLKHEEGSISDVDSGFAVVQESEIGKTSKRPKTEITDEDITAQALVFFFAGFDTSSTMMSYASYELALHPDIQEKLREEVDATLEKLNGEMTYNGLMGMKYLDMVVAETLRKWPPFAFNDRESVRSFTIEPKQEGEKPLHLPAGSVVLIPTYSIQRDPQYYSDPDKFDPERFSDENKHKIHPFSYMPFGAGPRNCIGSRFALMEGKIVLAEIISKFEIVPVEKTVIPIVFSKKNFNPVPDEGFWVGLKPRTNI